MTITLPILKISRDDGASSKKLIIELQTHFKLCYLDDPDTNGKSWYLWNYKKHQVVRKLLRVIRGVATA